MTSIFLSYDRDDAAKARSIAHALEKAGHSVWWDRYIKGGSRYAAEIEKALREAEAVVVLWSRNSVQSDWVRDEAAKGRDSGRLVPARIDNAELPLGFGQHHTTDLSKWRGRAGSAPFKALLDAIDGVGSGETVVRPAMPSRATNSRGGQILLIAVVAAVLIIGIILWRTWNRGSTAPVVEVAAVEGNPAARSLTDDLFIKLGILQAARADALQLVEQNSDAKADLKFRVDQQGDDKRIHATVALLAGDNGGLLWSREFQQERRRDADLRQQVAYFAAQVLACALEAKSTGGEIETATLRLYLNGCAGLSEGLADNESLVQIFSKVVERAPNFEGGWAKLLLAETWAFQESNLNDAAIRKNLQAHIKQARKLNPTMAEAYIALSWLVPMRPISGWMPLSDEAVRRNPHHAYALTNHSDDMFHVGRVRQAMEDMRQAVRSDPLSPSLRGFLINALANGNEYEAAKKALDEAERLWPGASNLVAVRFHLMRRYGDPREALKMLRTGTVSRQFVSPAVESFLEARIDPSPAKIAKAIDEARAVSAHWFGNYIQTLAEFGRKDELIGAMTKFDPQLNLGLAAIMFQDDFTILHNDPRFMAIADRWGLLDYWRASGKWPDFCFEPDLPYDCKAEAAKLAA